MNEVEAKAIPFGRWILLALPWQAQERFLGYAYLDAQAGASAKGGPESAADLAERPGHTVRLPMPVPMQVLTPDEARARGLPQVPGWVELFGPQPDPEASWRRDPDLQGCFHGRYPDDLQVMVHDGEPRRTGRQRELCWVRLTGAEEGPARRFLFDPRAAKVSETEFRAKYAPRRTVYLGRLLNAPRALESVRQGDTLRFVAGGGLALPWMVTAEYLAEREGWWIGPCNQCGMAECLDPPSVMIALRFSGQAPGATVEMFTAFCGQCGGVQVLSRRPGP